MRQIKFDYVPRLNLLELEEAKNWILDCLWLDITCQKDLDELSIQEIEEGIDLHYAGGIDGFKAACMPLSHPPSSISVTHSINSTSIPDHLALILYVEGWGGE